MIWCSCREDGVANREDARERLERAAKRGSHSNGSLFSTRTWPLSSPLWSGTANDLLNSTAPPPSPATVDASKTAKGDILGTLKRPTPRLYPSPWREHPHCPSCQVRPPHVIEISQRLASVHQPSKNSESVMNLVHVLSRHDRIKRLLLSASVEYIHSGTHLSRALLGEERENGEEAYTISDVFLRNKLVFIWRVDQCCLLRIQLTPEGLTPLPFHRILGVSVKADGAPWTPLCVRIVDDSPMEKELVAMLDPSELHCHRLLVPCPRFGQVLRKYVKILVRVELALDEDGVQTVDLYQTIYCRMVRRDHRMPFRYFMRRCRKAWEDMPQSSRDATEATCFAMHAIVAFLKEKMM